MFSYNRLLSLGCGLLLAGCGAWNTGVQAADKNEPQVAPANGPAEPLEGAKPGISEQGKQLYEQNKFPEAIGVLEKAFQETPDDVGVNFYLGRCYYETGDYEAAVMAYDRVLTINPGLARVKLEMARSYFSLGVKDHSRTLFQEVLATNPPENVRKNIESFLSRIDSPAPTYVPSPNAAAAAQAAAAAPVAPKTWRSAFSGSIGFGVTVDDNVKVAHDSNVIDIVGGSITLDSASLPQSDASYNMTAIINHKWQLGDRPLFWKTTGMTYNTFYDTYDEQNLNFFGLMVGPAFESKNFLTEIRFLANQIDKDCHDYMHSFGVASTWTLLLTPHVLLGSGMKLENKEYAPDAHDENDLALNLRKKDATNSSINIGPMFIWGKNRLGLRVGYEHEEATAAQYTYNRNFFSARYDRLLPKDFGVFAAYKFQDTEFQDPDAYAAFTGPDEGRTDSQHDLTVGVTKKLWKSLTAELSYTYTSADSTVVLYQYERNAGDFTLTWSF